MCSLCSKTQCLPEGFCRVSPVGSQRGCPNCANPAWSYNQKKPGEHLRPAVQPRSVMTPVRVGGGVQVVVPGGSGGGGTGYMGTGAPGTGTLAHSQ